MATRQNILGGLLYITLLVFCVFTPLLSTANCLELQMVDLQLYVADELSEDYQDFNIEVNSDIEVSDFFCGVINVNLSSDEIHIWFTSVEDELVLDDKLSLVFTGSEGYPITFYQPSNLVGDIPFQLIAEGESLIVNFEKGSIVTLGGELRANFQCDLGENIPTIGQWGLFITGLFMSCLGLVTIKRHEYI